MNGRQLLSQALLEVCAQNLVLAVKAHWIFRAVCEDQGHKSHHMKALKYACKRVAASDTWVDHLDSSYLPPTKPPPPVSPSSPPHPSPDPPTPEALPAPLERYCMDVRAALGPSEQVTSLIRHACLHGPARADESSWDAPPEALLASMLPTSTCDATFDYVDALCTTSAQLTSHPRAKRQALLAQQLELINADIQGAAEGGVPVWNVLGGGVAERVLKLCSGEARVLNSRERAPFLLPFEVLKLKQPLQQGAGLPTADHEGQQQQLYADTDVTVGTSPRRSPTPSSPLLGIPASQELPAGTSSQGQGEGSSHGSFQEAGGGASRDREGKFGLLGEEWQSPPADPPPAEHPPSHSHSASSDAPLLTPRLQHRRSLSDTARTSQAHAREAGSSSLVQETQSASGRDHPGSPPGLGQTRH